MVALDFLVCAQEPTRAQTVAGYLKSAFAKEKDYDGAIADYTKIIELEPANRFNYSRRVSAKWSKKDWEGAIADFTKAMGDIEGAKADYENAPEVDPDYAPAEFALKQLNKK